MAKNKNYVGLLWHQKYDNLDLGEKMPIEKPPFFTGADFMVRTKLGDEQIEKEPSIIEERAYKDTWSGGIASHLMFDSVWGNCPAVFRLLDEKLDLIPKTRSALKAHHPCLL